MGANAVLDLMLVGNSASWGMNELGGGAAF